MNKFKLSLFAVIAAGVVGCGGGGGAVAVVLVLLHTHQVRLSLTTVLKDSHMSQEKHILKPKEMVLIRLTRYRHFGLKTLI